MVEPGGPPNAGLFYSREIMRSTMTKITKDKFKQVKKKQKKDELLPLDDTNYKILIGGLFIIFLGYIALSYGPWDGSLSLTIAPILLVIGYCVVIPISIIYRKKTQQDGTALTSPGEITPQK
jgi:hypothetical protein